MHDEAFADYVADHLSALPGVVAVSLGGSRAQGTHRPDSDWDFAQAASYTAHAVLAARGQWVTNDKTLLTRAGLREIDELIAVTGAGHESLLEAVDRSMELCSRAMDDARAGR